MRGTYGDGNRQYACRRQKRVLFARCIDPGRERAFSAVALVVIQAEMVHCQSLVDLAFALALASACYCSLNAVASVDGCNRH